MWMELMGPLANTQSNTLRIVGSCYEAETE